MRGADGGAHAGQCVCRPGENSGLREHDALGLGSRRLGQCADLLARLRVYAPLTAGLLSPVKADAALHTQHRSQLDRLYQRVVDDLDKLMQAVGLKDLRVNPNANKIPTTGTITV